MQKQGGKKEGKGRDNMEATTVSHQGGEREAELVVGYLSMGLQSVCQRVQAMNKSDSRIFVR